MDGPEACWNTLEMLLELLFWAKKNSLDFSEIEKKSKIAQKLSKSDEKNSSTTKMEENTMRNPKKILPGVKT